MLVWRRSLSFSAAAAAGLGCYVTCGAIDDMGAWGTAIFSDDTAADTRDAFTDFIADGLTPPQATDRLIRESADILEDKDDAGVF